MVPDPIVAAVANFERAVGTGNDISDGVRTRKFHVNKKSMMIDYLQKDISVLEGLVRKVRVKIFLGLF